jgi:hypothetical protein
VSVGEILSESWTLYTRFFWRLVGTAAIVFVVLDLIGAVLYQLGKGSTAGGVFFGLIGFIVSWVGLVWVQGALVEAVNDVRDGKADSTIGELYSRVASRLPALIAAGVLAAIGISIGLILLIAPGLFLLTRWCLFVPAIVLEKKSAGDSFGRSNELVKGASWPVLGVILIAVVGGGIASGIISGIFQSIFSSFFGYWLGNLVGHSIFVPFVAAVLTLMYFKRAEAETPVAAAAPAES